LHIDEIKDTPSAFAQKTKAGKQMARHIAWLQQKTPKDTEDPSKGNYIKEVGYYVNKSGNGFDQLLDEGIVAALKAVATNQAYKGLLNVSLIEMSADRLEEIMKAAHKHLMADKKVRMKPEYYTKAFASYESTMATLAE